MNTLFSLYTNQQSELSHFLDHEKVEELLSPHVSSLVESLVKLLRAAYHAHLAGALTTGEQQETLTWSSAYDSEDDSVIV